MRSERVLLVATVLAISTLTLDAQKRWWPFKKSPQTFKVFKTADLAIEYPERDWQQLRGAGSVVVTFISRREDAAVIVDRTRQETPVTGADITDLSAQLEAESVRARDPKASDLSSTLAEHPLLGTTIRIEFVRPNPSGMPERVRQLSVPAGWYLYRVICSARAEDFPKVEAIFNHVLTSLRIEAPTAPPEVPVR